jgi:hypothetical protein
MPPSYGGAGLIASAAAANFAVPISWRRVIGAGRRGLWAASRPSIESSVRQAGCQPAHWTASGCRAGRFMPVS